MENKNIYLFYALYKEMHQELLKNSEQLNNFVELFKSFDPSEKNKEEFDKLISFLKNNNKLSLLSSPDNFKPEKYEDVYKLLPSKITEFNNIRNQKKLDTNNKEIYTNNLKLISVLKDISNIEDSLQNITDEAIDTASKLNPNVDTLIKDYTGAFNNITDILSFYTKYDICKYCTVTSDKFDEFTVIDKYIDFLNNTQLSVIFKFISFKNDLLTILLSDNYDETIKQLSEKYKDILHLENMDLKYDKNQFQELMLYGKNADYDNVFKTILKTSNVTDDIFDNMDIKQVKDKTLYSYIEKLDSYEYIDVYNNKKINIQQLQEYIINNVKEYYVQIENDIKFVKSFNIQIGDEPIKKILKILHTNKSIFLTKLIDKDTKSVQGVTDTFNESFKKYLSDNNVELKYKEDKSDDILNIIVNILDDSGNINIQYLQDTIENYNVVVRAIINWLPNSEIYTLYQGLKELTIIKENYGIYFQGIRLFEDEEMSGNVDEQPEQKEEQKDNQENNIKDHKYDTVSDALDAIIKFSDEKGTDIISYTKEHIISAGAFDKQEQEEQPTEQDKKPEDVSISEQPVPQETNDLATDVKDKAKEETKKILDIIKF